jgi:hypothetical protein
MYLFLSIEQTVGNTTQILLILQVHDIRSGTNITPHPPHPKATPRWMENMV